MRYLIIGNSAAGLNGAEAIRELDTDGEVTIVSEEDYPPYSRCLIPYFMEGKVSEDDMLYRPSDYYQAHSFRIMLGRRVVKVDTSKMEAQLEDGERLMYDRLLLATGGSPKIPDTTGMDKEGVLGFRTTRDLHAILRALKDTRNAAVLGGGCIGLMAACGLRAKGAEVLVVIRSPHLLSQVADAEAGEMFRRRFEENGVRVISGASVDEVRGDARVAQIHLDNGEQLECQLIVVGKGVAPNVTFLEGSGVAVNRGVVVDENLQTNIPEIYAAGDVAETTDVVTGEKAVNAIWPCAAEQGRIAGANMAGQARTYVGSMRMNSAEFFGLPLISIGVTKPPSDEYQVLSRRQETRNTYRKVVLKQNKIVGLVMVGEIENAGVYRALIQKKADISSVKDRLLDRNFGYPDILPLVAGDRQRFSEPEWRHSLISYRR